jgi:hypothetical protein
MEEYSMGIRFRQYFTMKVTFTKGYSMIDIKNIAK